MRKNLNDLIKIDIFCNYLHAYISKLDFICIQKHNLYDIKLLVLKNK